MKHTNYYFTLAILFCIGFSNTLFAQKAKRPFTVSGEFLMARDLSKQSPDGQKSFTVKSFEYSKAGGLLFEFPLKNNLWFGLGYRWKEYWATTKYNFSASEKWIGNGHSLALRMAWKKTIWNRFALDLSPGILTTFRLQSPGGSSMSTLTDGTGALIFTSTETFRDEGPNKVNTIVSLDAMAKINCRLSNYFNMFFGLGYTQGLKTWSKANYTYGISTGESETGIVTTNGTYYYGIIGARIAFRQ